MPLIRAAAGNILFIHVPKTGGTSIEHHLGLSFALELTGRSSDRSLRCKLQHCHGELLVRLLSGVPVARSFMIVRHPVERLVSEFKFQSRRKLRFYRGLSFSRWLRRSLLRAGRDPYYRDNHFRPQAEFEAFGPKIFRFEAGLQPCFRWLHDDIGLPLPAEPLHMKKSRAKDVALAEADWVLIEDFYGVDFERYGYSRQA